MPERGQFISDEDFLTLKSLIDAEIGRRGKTEGTAQGQSVGSMAAYRGAAYQYNVPPADGVSVDAEHIQKITRLVDAVQGGATTPARGDQVAASGLAQAAATVSTLSNIPETATATGCSGQCTGLCSNGCNTSCTSCTGSCGGGCVGTCRANCANDCTATCRGTCQGSCSNTCLGNCTNTCNTTCTASCANDCTNGCKTGCKGGCKRGCDGATIGAIPTVRPAARIVAEEMAALQTVKAAVLTAAKETAIRIVERNAQITATEVVVGVPEAVLADAHHALDSCGNKKGAAK